MDTHFEVGIDDDLCDDFYSVIVQDVLQIYRLIYILLVLRPLFNLKKNCQITVKVLVI